MVIFSFYLYKYIMTKSRYNKKPSLISHIYSPRDNPIKWEKNQDDPFIYLSFSYEQFKAAFEWLMQQTNHHFVSGDVQFQSLDVEVISELEKIARIEWLEKAKLPIKFLPSDISGEEIRDKNVYFVFADLTLSSERAFTSMSTHPLFSRMRFSTLRNIKIADLTPKDIYIFLHEGMHGILGAKHFRPYDRSDYGPFTAAASGKSELDCSNTVLAYEEDCSIVRDNRITAHIYDDEGVYLRSEEVPNIFNYPVTLGELDLAAAEVFNLEWTAQQTEADTLPQLKQVVSQETFFQSTIHTMRSSTACILSKIKNTASEYADKFETAAKSYALDVKTTCPSYFPPEQSIMHLHYWYQPLQHPGTLQVNSTLPELTCSPSPFLMLN